MMIRLLAFGIVKDLFPGSSLDIELPENPTVDVLKKKLDSLYPEMQKLASYMIAVNNNYASDGDIIYPDDEIAIIPPVSGG
jgi:molybdopterin synthase sulfur carrier subunit